MHTAFTQALQQYYAHEGNRIKFRNGLTLNQFALEMWEASGEKGIDASALSRILSGERCFTSKQLTIFAKLLHLSETEYSQLLSNFCQHQLSDMDINLPLFDSNHSAILTISQSIQKIDEARSFEALPLALRWIQATEVLIRMHIAKTKNILEQKALYHLWGTLLVRKGWTYLEHLPHTKIPQQVLPLPKQFVQIANITGDSVFLGLSEAFSGRISYSNKNYKQSLEHDSKALAWLTDPEQVIWSLGRKALCFAMLGQTNEIAPIETEANKQIELLANRKDTSSCATPLSILPGRCFANVYTLLGKPKFAQNYLDRTWKTYTSVIKTQEGNYKHRSKIVLYHAESFFNSRFGLYNQHHEKLKEEVKTLVHLFGYNQYEVIPKTSINQLL